MTMLVSMAWSAREEQTTGKNAVKLEANMRREQAKNNQQDGEPAEKFSIPEVMFSYYSKKNV